MSKITKIDLCPHWRFYAFVNYHDRGSFFLKLKLMAWFKWGAAFPFTFNIRILSHPASILDDPHPAFYVSHTQYVLLIFHTQYVRPYWIRVYVKIWMAGQKRVSNEAKINHLPQIIMRAFWGLDMKLENTRRKVSILVLFLGGGENPNGFRVIFRWP